MEAIVIIDHWTLALALTGAIGGWTAIIWGLLRMVDKAHDLPERETTGDGE